MGIVHSYSGSSFLTLLKTEYPDLLPRHELSSQPSGLTHGTTICALKYEGGVVVAGDRRATADGHIIMSDDVVKVFKVDNHSVMAIAGAFGPSVKMARLFQVELEHYEKMEGVALSMEGKSNKLSQMIELNFPAAVQGMIVMPLYAGYDVTADEPGIFEYDITGGLFTRSRHEPFATSGSGGERARATFEHFASPGLTRDDAVELCVKALQFAARKDTATGGQKFIVMAIERDGVIEVRRDDD